MTPKPDAVFNTATDTPVTPGYSQTRSRAWGNVGTKHYPKFGLHGIGPYLITQDGEKLIDLAGANAAVPLGYRDLHVETLVDMVRRDGGILSLPTMMEVEASEALVAAVPSAEQVRWVKTGSEATTAACRIAQAATGRQRILTMHGGYHGWHGLLGKPHPADGVLDSIDRETAAVFWEPPRFTEINMEWVTRLRDRCDATGTVLIFDEIVYGFRWATAGSQTLTGIEPDLACFSKALGNGYAVGCVCGSAAVMNDHALVVSSTFGGDRVGLAAAMGVLDSHQGGATLFLHDRADKLWAILHKAISGTVVRFEGYPVHWRFLCDTEDQMDRFLDSCLDGGVLVHRHANNANTTMTDEVIHRVGEVVHKAAIDAG